MSALENARAAWGDELPEWVAQLASECETTSQNRVAGRLGRSPAVVSQVIRRKYPGDMAAVEQLVRGVFLNGTLECPELGVLPSHECLNWQAKARHFGNANMLRVRMFRACHGCSRFTKQTEGESDVS